MASSCATNSSLEKCLRKRLEFEDQVVLKALFPLAERIANVNLLRFQIKGFETYETSEELGNDLNNTLRGSGSPTTEVRSSIVASGERSLRLCPRGQTTRLHRTG